MKYVWAVLWLLLLTGCGSSTNQTIRVAAYPGLLEQFPIYLTHELGHFQAEGLTVAFDDFTAGSKAFESLVAGSTDVVYDNYTYTLIMTAQQQKIKSFVTTLLVPTTMLAAAPGKANSIQRVEDLKGLMVGVGSFGGIHHRYLEFFLSRHGLSINDIKLTTIGVGPSGILALERNKVDAGILNGSTFNVLKRRAPQTRALVDPRTKEGCREVFGVDTMPTTSLLAKSGWIAKRPDTARKLATAMVKTLRWIQGRAAEEIRSKIPDRMRTADVEADLETIRYVKAGLSSDGRMPNGGAEIVRKVFASSFDKLREANFDLAATWTNEFVDAR